MPWVRSTLEEFSKVGKLPDERFHITVPFAAPDPASESLSMTPALAPALGCGCAARSSSADAVTIGRVLRERYVIEQRIGTGGKGAVFKALDRFRASLPDAQQRVALKILHTCSGCSEETLVSLRRELHCAQALSHRNIVNVFELDRDADIVFFTMELLEGEPLSSVLARMRPGTMRRSDAWQIIRQLGAGLEHAHERAVVHGDLKPENILITPSGELRILDFGAANMPASAATSGTPAYASCELLEGKPADSRDDLYALACICYELLAGVHPFDYRPATLARNFNVPLVRPLAVTNRQWRALQTGLSWHRAGRSIPVRWWMRKLTMSAMDDAKPTALQDLTRAAVPASNRRWRAAAIALSVVAATALCGTLIRPRSAQPLEASPTVPTSAAAANVETVAASPPSKVAVAESWSAQTPPPEAKVAANKASGPERPAPPKAPLLSFSANSYQVQSGDRFVEVRVQRNQTSKDGSFVWWTEPATAKQGVDYVNQAKATQTFPHGGRITRFYVKLLPDSLRAHRDYFYVAIAEAGNGQSPRKVTRAQVWLPIYQDQLQARR